MLAADARGRFHRGGHDRSRRQSSKGQSRQPRRRDGVARGDHRGPHRWRPPCSRHACQHKSLRRHRGRRLVRREDGFLTDSPTALEKAPLAEMIAQSLGVGRCGWPTKPMSARSRSSDAGPPNARHLTYVSGEVGVGLGIIHDGSRCKVRRVRRRGRPTVISPRGATCRCGSIAAGNGGGRGGARAAGRILWPDSARQQLIDEVVSSVPTRATHRCSNHSVRVGRWLASESQRHQHLQTRSHCLWRLLSPAVPVPSSSRWSMPPDAGADGHESRVACAGASSVSRRA